jgi:hypothetical protein
MTREREVCLCSHDKASHHVEQHSDDGIVITINGQCLAPWCRCTLYLDARLQMPPGK